MTNVVRLPGSIVLPSMSPPLAKAVRYELASRAPHPGNETSPAHRSSLPAVRLTAALIPEAKRLADAMSAELRSITAAELAEWLTPINLGCSNPQPRDDFATRCRAFAELCAELPSIAFTADARRDLAEKTKHFPAAAEILAALKPEASRIAATLDALYRLAARAPEPGPPQKPEPVSAEQRALDDAKTAAMLAEQKSRISASAHRDRTFGVKAVPVHPLHLMASYRTAARQGGPTAAAVQIRLKAMEAEYPELADQLDHIEALQARAKQHAAGPISKEFAE